MSAPPPPRPCHGPTNVIPCPDGCLMFEERKDDELACKNCSCRRGRHSVVSSSPALSSTPSSPILIEHVHALTIEIWKFEPDDQDDDVRNILVHGNQWKQLYDGVKERFKDKIIQDGLEMKFTLYYIINLSQPKKSKMPVENDVSFQAYLSFTSTSNHPYTQLYLHIPTLMNGKQDLKSDGKPISPTKPPLSINTALANLYSNTQTIATSSPKHLSPPPLKDSPSSPNSPREREQREWVLARDSDPFTLLTPESALKAVWKCAFCGGKFVADGVDCGHLVPSSIDERLKQPVDEITIIQFGGIHSVYNGVTVCKICHKYYDKGLIWTEAEQPQSMANTASSTSSSSSPSSLASVVASTPPFTLRLQVDSDIQDDSHAKQLIGRSVLRPVDPKLSSAFPPLIWWQWRREWAVLKRQSELERRLAKLQVSGNCGCGQPWNKQCKNRDDSNNPLCASCCRMKQSNGGVICGSHPLVNKNSGNTTPKSATTSK